MKRQVIAIECPLELMLRIVRDNDLFAQYSAAVNNNDFSAVVKICDDHFVYTSQQLIAVKSDFDVEVELLHTSESNVYNETQLLLEHHYSNAHVMALRERSNYDETENDELFRETE
jgi:hypothetical protein